MPVEAAEMATAGVEMGWAGAVEAAPLGVPTEASETGVAVME